MAGPKADKLTKERRVEAVYRPFRNNRLIRKPGVEIPEGINEYGMKLVKIK